ncbi:3D domain-containing protein [Candidatus Falkowbacteria bacterium]|jgi:3D (Asp-Asp-Asp) domain-containing protein|nr:3D domain-containing protein [Candidatus Falkowbacteria bacterium]MBT7007115.1 3D domain-containing protein [Candidatus Falkowbacteria bacterium]
MKFVKEDNSMSIREKVIFTLILAVFVMGMANPTLTKADAPIISRSNMELAFGNPEKLDLLSQRFIDNKDKKVNDPFDQNVVRTVTVIATAYSSTVDQCDDTPCITANGFNVCEHGIEDTIAANFLRFGTRVKLPEVSGDKIYIVRDRMNPKYDHRIDLWMTSRNKAITFGKRLVKIEIVE